MSITTTRQHIQQQRLAIKPDLAKQAALQATQQLINLPVFAAAHNIAAYIAVNGEIGTQALIETVWQSAKQLYMPIIQTDNSLKFAAYNQDTQTSLNQYHIPEPQHDKTELIEAAQLDLVIVPLVAFDEHCHRIGMGAGYYDRTLAHIDKSKTSVIGFAYDFQKLNLPKPQAWDIAMDWIVSEQAYYKRNKLK